MTDSDRTEFAKALALLWSAFPQAKPLETATAGAYWLALKDLSLEAVRSAAVLAMQQQTFVPSIAELRKLAGVHTPEQRAAMAWEFLRGIHYRMTWELRGREVAFDDPVLTATVANLGGLHRVDTSGHEPWARKEFDRLYTLYSAGTVPMRILLVEGSLPSDAPKNIPVCLVATRFPWAKSRQECLPPPRVWARPKLPFEENQK